MSQPRFTLHRAEIAVGLQLDVTAKPLAGMKFALMQHREEMRCVSQEFQKPLHPRTLTRDGIVRCLEDNLADVVQQFDRDVGQHLFEQRLAGVEIRVKGAVGDPGPIRDARDRGPGEAVLAHCLDSCGHDLGTGDLTLLGTGQTPLGLRVRFALRRRCGEIADKGIRVWALGATGPYSISTTSKVLAEPEDFTGTPLRAGSALHTIALENLGATPVTLPGPQAYEALSRKTIDGIIIAISDWPSYSIQELLRHSIVDLSIGHWESYLAISDEAWDRMSEENQQVFDQTAREIALFNANKWNENGVKVQEESATNDGGSFVSINDLSQAMQDHIADAGRKTWIDWIEKTEAAGHPARATAQLYAELIQAEGSALPDGVAEYLAD